MRDQLTNEMKSILALADALGFDLCFARGRNDTPKPIDDTIENRENSSKEYIITAVKKAG